MSPGQYLERPTLVPTAGGLVLEGVAHRGSSRPGLLVLPPPPQSSPGVSGRGAGWGGGMDHVVAAELTYAVSRAGHPTLRFNFRGVGASQGAVSRDPRTWLEDASAALRLAQDNADGAPPAVAAIGASDAVALELARLEAVAAVALVSPGVLRPADLVALGPRPWPVLVVAAELALEGDTDAQAWRAGLDAMGGELVVVPGTGRGFDRNLPMVGKAVAALIARLGPGRRDP